MFPQANVDRSLEPSEWKLESLAAKLVQYCPLLEGLTADDLKDNSNVRGTAVQQARMNSKAGATANCCLRSHVQLQSHILTLFSSSWPPALASRCARCRAY